jgi:hypothetical protein
MITALSEHPERDQSMLDLSPYSLTAEQVVHVASHFPKIQVLNLDKNPHITAATLTRLLPSLPELTRLIIYDCPNISAVEVRTLRFSGSFPNLLAVYHRGYIMMSTREAYENGRNTDLASTRSSFTFALASDGEVIGETSVPFLSPRAVVISMCDIFEYRSWRDPYTEPYRNTHTIAIRCCFSSLPREPNVPFAERAIGPPREHSPREHGFVKFKFSEPAVGQHEQELSPTEVEVTNLAGWLEALDATDKVEKEWVEKLSGYLGSEDSLITKERAMKCLAYTTQDEYE